MKSKSYAQQIDSAQVMLSGLKANRSALEKRGVSEEFVAEFENTLINIIAKNNEQEKLKADLKSSTAQLNVLLTTLKKNISESTTVIKMEIPQPQWKEFGIHAKK